MPDMVRAVPAATVLRMKQQAQLLYNQYFSSVHSIVHSTLQVRTADWQLECPLNKSWPLCQSNTPILIQITRLAGVCFSTIINHCYMIMPPHKCNGGGILFSSSPTNFQLWWVCRSYIIRKVFESTFRNRFRLSVRPSVPRSSNALLDFVFILNI